MKIATLELGKVEATVKFTGLTEKERKILFDALCDTTEITVEARS